MKNEKWFMLVIIAYLLINIPGLFIPIIVNAAKYAQIGREMLDNHDWINLTIGHEAYDQKPPLLFWIAAIVFRLSGISVINYKAVVLLISFAGIYGTYRLAELFYGKNTGLLAVAFLATSLGYVHFHNDIHTDTLLIVPVILSVWQYAAYFKFRKEYQFYMGTVFAGLGMLTKGPVSIVVIGSAVGLHLLFTKSFKDIFNYRWLIALPIVLILTIPALLGLYSQFGPEGIKFFFWTNNAGRITGSYAGHSTDPTFYIHTTLYMMLPWSVLCFTGIYHQIREKIKQRWAYTDKDEFYTIGGLLFYLFINSAAKAKNPHYEMVVLPFLAIIGSRWTIAIVEKGWSKTQKVLGSVHLTMAIVMIILAYIFIAYVFPEKQVWIWVVIIALTGAFIYSLSRKSSMTKQLTYLLFSSSILLFTLNTNILPHMSRYQSSFEACRIFNQKAEDKAKLHIFTGNARYWEIFLYAKNYGRYMVTADDFKRVSPPANDWLYTTDEGLALLSEMQIPVDTVSTLPHNSMTHLSLKILNPATRASKLQARYLVKIREK